MSPMRQACPSRHQLLHRLARRDGQVCAWCSRELNLRARTPEVALELGLPMVTVDHVRLASANGSRHHNNLLLACTDCNAARGHIPIVTWAKQCRQRGMSVNETAVEAAIERLHRGAPYMTKKAYGRWLRREAKRIAMQQKSAAATPAAA